VHQLEKQKDGRFMISKSPACVMAACRFVVDILTLNGLIAISPT